MGPEYGPTRLAHTDSSGPSKQPCVVMAFVQCRKGPDVVGSFRLLKLLEDGLKLIIKEPCHQDLIIGWSSLVDR